METQPLLPTHWPAVRAIYEEGMATGQATFETTAPAWDTWDQAHLPHCRLIATTADGPVLGWATLISTSEQHGIWTLQAGIFEDNAPSLPLHAAAGFRTVGRRERIGQVRGAWRNTVLLERRSAVAGVV